jgi:hypothetical protein
MKKNLGVIAVLFFVILFISKFSFAQNIKQDTLKEVTTTGIFTGEKVTVGNFFTVVVYKINEYCIAPEDIPESLLNSLKGRNVLVTGKLKIVIGKTMPAKTSTDGKIYEPYKEPDRKFIAEPTFTTIYDSKEPEMEK